MHILQQCVVAIFFLLIDSLNLFDGFQRILVSKVESSEDCRQILRARMSDQCLHSAPIANDVTDYDPRASGHEWATGAGGGFPCQVPHKCLVFKFSSDL